MRTEVHIVARVGATPRVRAEGGLAVRRTGRDAVHLISTAATPLGGDHIDITVEVQDGARLDLRTVAATIALPSRTTRRSTAHWSVIVGVDAHLTIAPLPTIVAARAEHDTTTTVRADPSASVEIGERVQLGRHGETGGHWSGRLHVDLGGVPALRHRVILGGDSSEHTGDDRRAMISAFRYPDLEPAAVSATRLAARLALECGGSLTTALGRGLPAAQEAMCEVDLSSRRSVPCRHRSH